MENHVRLALIFYLVCAVICMFLSTVMHLFEAINAKKQK